jgi:hypothetical protein
MALKQSSILSIGEGLMNIQTSMEYNILLGSTTNFEIFISNSLLKVLSVHSICYVN